MIRKFIPLAATTRSKIGAPLHSFKSASHLTRINRKIKGLAQRRKGAKLMSVFYFTAWRDRSFRLPGRWTFDPPEADKCLLASGEFDVHLFLQVASPFPSFNPLHRGIYRHFNPQLVTRNPQLATRNYPSHKTCATNQPKGLG